MKQTRTIFILIFLILLFGCCKKIIEPSTSSISNDIFKVNDIYFVNNNLGFLIGTRYRDRPIELGPSNPWGPFATIYKTIDGGISWQNLSTWLCYEGHEGQSIIFTSENDGRAMTSCLPSYILKTSNQGASWSHQVSDGPYGVVGPSSFNIDNNTIILGYSISRDAGQSFQFMPNLPTPALITSFFFTDTTYGVCASTNGLIYKTNDIGNTWETLFNNPSYYFNNIYVAENNVIFAAANGEILRSTDTGLSWETVYSDPNDLVKEIEFVNSQIGFAVITGVNCNSIIKDCPYSRNGKILKTVNGGTSWSVNYANNSMDFQCLKVVDQNYYVVSGIRSTFSATPIVLRRSVHE